MMTLRERLGDLAGRTLTFVGDGNNVAASLAHAGAMLGLHIRVASPEGYELPAAVVADVRRVARHGATITLTNDPAAAVAGADAVYTDVWASMGQEDQADDAGAGVPAVSGERGADGQGGPGRAVHALPAGASRRGSDRRGDGLPGVGGLRSGRKPPARAEGAAEPPDE